MSNFIESLVNGNLEEFRKNINIALYAKAEEALNDRRAEIAAGLYSEKLDEEKPLSPKQKNIARLGGDPDKIDAEDLRILREKGKKGK